METCADCMYCIDGYCQAKDKNVNPDSKACDEYEEY